MIDIYLASPYEHEDSAIMSARIAAAAHGAAYLARQGFSVFSPIVYTAYIAKALPEWDRRDWIEFDEPFMEMCKCAVVLQLPGWHTSNGISYERTVFIKAGKPVFELGPRRILPSSVFTACVSFTNEDEEALNAEAVSWFERRATKMRQEILNKESVASRDTGWSSDEIGGKGSTKEGC